MSDSDGCIDSISALKEWFCNLMEVSEHMFEFDGWYNKKSEFEGTIQLPNGVELYYYSSSGWYYDLSEKYGVHESLSMNMYPGSKCCRSLKKEMQAHYKAKLYEDLVSKH